MMQNPADYYLFYVAIVSLTLIDPSNLRTLDAAVINNFGVHAPVVAHKIAKIALAVKSILLYLLPLWL